ncbi:MAG TPA: TOBE domain-containing protein, partial [Aggregatilineales bacterium]|nr:TOBE domain-containing protein [Aggregatilineales bacterium]
RPERIALRDLSDPLTDVASGINTLRGKISQVFYIGTDTRYAVHLETGDDIAVRMQNSSAESAFSFKQGQAVHVLFHANNARVLAKD